MHRNLDLKDAQENIVLHANLTSIYSLLFAKCKTRINMAMNIK